MSLADFMKQLQDQDASGIVYSEVPEQPVRVIPPEQTSVKIIAPISQSISKTPTKIKLKLERPQPAQEQSITYRPIEKPKVVEPVVDLVQPIVQQPAKPRPQVINKPEISTPPPVQRDETPEELFLKSKTEISKKDKWIEAYARAQASKKHNPYADRIRAGRFTILPDDSILALPDYDVMGKDPDKVLRDKWF